MYIKDDYNFEDLKKAVWSEAKKTVKKIDEAGKGDLLMSHLEELYMDEVPTLTTVNDLLWHDSEGVLMAVLGEDEEDEEDED